MKICLLFLSTLLFLSACASYKGNDVIVICPRYGKFQKGTELRELKLENIYKSNRPKEAKSFIKYLKGKDPSLTTFKDSDLIYPELSIEATKYITPRSHLFVLRGERDNIQKIFKILDKVPLEYYAIEAKSYDYKKFFRDPSYGIKEKLYIHINTVPDAF